MKQIIAAVVAFPMFAMAKPLNYDEAKVPPYTLEDPLVFADGRKLVDASEWTARRKEILDIFAREMYGQPPPEPEAVVTELFEEGPTLAGLGIRRQYHMWLTSDKSGPRIDWLVLLPNKISGTTPARSGDRRLVVAEKKKKWPVVLFLNYRGNHELLTDREIPVQRSWTRNSKEFGISGNMAQEKTRGLLRRTDSATVFPAEMILARGYAVMSACYCEVSPDDADVANGRAWTGVFGLWGERDESREDNVTSLGAWGWALSRGLDLAERIPEIDATRNVVTGCSRLGKAALLAAARDERFSVCVPIQTGGGGAPLAKHYFGECIATETRMFPHWFCKAYAKYADRECELPFDQHLLLAAVAPRALLVEGFNSDWFDTRGEFLALRAASPVWQFLGRKPLPEGNFPPSYDKSLVGSCLGYVRRGGQHGMSAYDWLWLLDFADTALCACSKLAAADTGVPTSVDGSMSSEFVTSVARKMDGDAPPAVSTASERMTSFRSSIRSTARHTGLTRTITRLPDTSSSRHRL